MSENDFNSDLLEEDDSEGSLTASGIAEYIRFNCCPRFFKLKFEGKEIKKRVWPEAFKPISPLLYGTGKALEEKKVAELKEKAAEYLDFTKYDPKQFGKSGWEKAVDSMNNLHYVIEAQIAGGENADGRPVLLYQVPMKGLIGVWDVKGIADLIAIWPLKDGKVKVRIFELKSSWKEQTAHRIQVAIYALLLSQELGALSSRVELEGGVINRETSLESLASESLPKFKLSPLIQDVQRLLAINGELNRIRQTPIEKVEFQLCWRCDNCGFNECCVVCAVENESIALLNLSRGEQKALRHHGVETLEDLAKLKVVLDTSDLRPYDFKDIPAKDPLKVQEISADPIVGPKLDWLVQRAQYMLGGIRQNSSYVSKSRWMPWLTGSGYGSLPEDSLVAGTDMALMSRPDCMIRVYLFVEWDYMLDVISLLSARVSCTRYKADPPSVSEVIASLPDDHQQCIEEERKLMERFFLGLTQAITKVANEINSPDEAPIHLYFFSRQERDLLMKSVCRQPSLMSARAVRDLLGLRQAIDQPMFSILQDEVQHRKALKFHSYGLLPLLEQACFFDRNQWRVTRKDGTIADLNLIFRDGLFNYSLPFRRNPDCSISFLKAGNHDGYYPARARFGDQLPIEYLWAVKGRLDNFTDVKGPAKILLDKRKWCDYPHRTRRITDEDLRLMGAKICLALECIERSLNIRNRRLGKKPIPIPTISSFTLGPATLERSCREFLDLEYFSKRQEMYQHYALLPYQRVASGRSLIFQCTSVFESDLEFVVKGKLIYEGIGLPKTECLANACRVKGADGSSSGDWMVVTELRPNASGQFEEAQRRSPSEVEKSARAIVDKVDIPKLGISIKVVTWPSGKNRKYSAWHNLPTTDPEKAQGKYMQLFQEGRYYILDELADDIISDRAAKSLDYAGNNVLYGLLADYLAGKTGVSSKHEALPKAGAASFLTWVEARRFPPKAEQARFVDRVFGKEPIVMLQGPPGTGKTETLQLAVLAHVAAHRAAASRCRVLMVAPTHKAIQEFVNKLARCWKDYVSAGGGDLKDLKIFRVLGSNAASAKLIDGVKYINYNEDEDTVEELSGCLMNQSTLTSDVLASYPMVLCLTPPGLYGLMKKIGDKEPPWGESYFDLLVVDEASMMRLPELILSGSFLSKNSQILVAGDHRQLPPIVSHNWEKEDRRTLEEMASFLSAMDFLRLLRNEDLGMERIKCQNPADIPAERLCESHRCHRAVADFLREWVYEKDKIDFHSDQKETLPQPKPATEGLGVVLEPENVFTLIVHDEAESFQSNVVEAQIVHALVRDASTDSVGVITPHNAQKGLLKNLLGDAKGVRVDTVERYQGGEADFIIISTTVSDPDYVRTESEFLLNLNRINVAISRMKKKLVIVASRSIFEFMPQDAKDYDKAMLWRGISETVGFTADSEPQWMGALSEFLGQPSSQVKVEVYVKSDKKPST